MLAKIDEKLLWLTNQLVKKFNWLTGKDNFFLARGFCILASFFFWIVVIRGKHYEIVFLSFLLFPYMFSGVNYWEQESKRERETGAKNYDDFLVLSIFRKLLLLSLPLLYVFSPLGVDYSNGGAVMLFLLYMLSADNPPYSRSHAWELLKGKIKALFSPVPVLAPVPVSADA